MARDRCSTRPEVANLPVTAVAQDKMKDPPKSGPKGTPYAHIMVPTTSMAKSVPKAPAEKKAADKK
jgi:hypothetical protein